MCESIETTAIVCRERNGRRICVLNPMYREIGVIQVDDCLITDTKRCDWMIRLPIQKRLKFGTAALKLAELKGSDVMKAFEQLEATLVHAVLVHERNLVDECIVVSQLNPAINSTVQIEIARFVDAHKVMARVTPYCEINAEL